MADWPDLKANWADHEEMVAADFNEYAVRSNEHSEAINNIPNLEIGTVGTSFPGEDASAEIVAGEGEESDQRLLNLIIPRGEQGPPGPVGNLLTFKGPWDASTNTPELADGVGDIGDSWTVEVGATVDLGSGAIAFSAGDWAVYDGYIWVRSTAQSSAIAEAIDNLIAGAPGALDTLNELAAALGDDANFATTIATTLAGKVPTTRTLTAGTGLSGGGDLSANRTLAVSYGTTAGTSAQGNDSRLVPENNVLALGATGDGVTDDTTAIHAARDAAGVGGRVTFPAGTYLVSGLTASVAKQHWVLLGGATIKAASGSAKILNVTATGVSVQGGVFDGVNQTVHDGSKGGIVVSAGADGATFTNVTVQNSPFYGIAVYNSNRIAINGCTLTNSYYSGIWVQNTLAGPSNIYDFAITNNRIDGSTATGAVQTHTSGIGLYGNSVTQRINRVRVTNNTIILPYNQSDLNTGCIGPYNCTEVVVSDNICIGGTISISCPNLIHGTISGNTVRGFDQLGIELPDGSGGAIDHVTVSGNTIDPDGAGGVSGIQTSAGTISNLTIIGNTIKNFVVTCNLINFGSGSILNEVAIVGNTLVSSVGSGQQFYGIDFNATATNVTINGNVIDGGTSPTSYGVIFFGTTTGVIVAGNQFSNLTAGPVVLGAYTSGKTLDYIRLSGNSYVNCAGLTLVNLTSGGATVGSNVVSEAVKPIGIDVTAYGAKGNGTSDDTAAIHAAKTAAGVGGKVVFPPGAYLVSGLTASVASQTWVLSDGATVKMKTGATSILNITGAGVTVTGGVFDGVNGTATDGTQQGVVAAADGVTLDKIKVQNSPLYGIYSSGHNQIRISRCTIVNSYSAGIWVQNVITGPSNIYDISITDNLIDNTSGGTYSSGISIYGQSVTQRINRVLVSGNTIKVPYDATSNQSNQVGCIGPYCCADFVVSDNICYGGYTSISTVGAIRGVISNNTVRGFSVLGIELTAYDASNVAVIGNAIDPDGTLASAGIQTSGCTVSDLTLVGNNIKGFTAACNLINIGSGTVLDTTVIGGNTLNSTSTGQFHGVMFNGIATSVTMTGNTFDAHSTTNSRGVEFAKTTTGVSITGNQFTNCVQAVRLGGYQAGTVQDYIRLVGNVYVNCGASLTDATSSPATVGTNIFSDGVTTATVSSVALRDSNANLLADAFIPSVTSTVTAAGTTTLTVDSTEVQILTGLTTQTMALPTTSVVAGRRFTVINSSTGLVTVTSGGATVAILASGGAGVFVALQATPTTAAHWSYNFTSPTLNQINDTNGNTAVSLTATTSAVNYINVTNRATGNAPIIQSAGSDANVDLLVKTQGTGAIYLAPRGLIGLLVSSATSAVNYVTIGSNATGVQPTINAQGSDTDISLNINSKGAGVVKVNNVQIVDLSSSQTLTNKILTSPKIGTSILDTNGNTMVTLTPTASAVNGISLLNAATAGSPSIQATGSDTDVGLNVYAKGAGAITVRASTNGMIAQFVAPASAVNYFYFQSAATTSALTLIALGSDTNISISANPKGTGVFQVGGVTVPTVSSTSTLTNKRVTQRVGTVASSATPAINVDSVDVFTITALAADITSMTSGLTGTPTDGQHLLIRFKDNGTARAITWGASFTGNLLSTTVISKTHVQELVYDSASSKWAGTYYDATGY